MVIEIQISSLDQTDFTIVEGTFNYNNQFYNNLNAKNLLKNYSINKTKKILNSLNGNFAVILKRHNNIFIAVDHVRSKPLFYAIRDQSIIVSSNAYWIKKKLNKFCYNSNAFLELWYFLYCLNDNTLIEEIKQLEAGTYLSGKFAKG